MIRSAAVVLLFSTGLLGQPPVQTQGPAKQSPPGRGAPGQGAPGQSGPGQPGGRRQVKGTDQTSQQADEEEAGRALNAVPPAPSLQFDVRVHQDPMRLAPGETGTVLLHVVLPQRGTQVQTNGSLEFAGSQGPFAFGTARWDAPRGGRGSYGDSFLIRLPVTVKSGTKFGKYDINGYLSLSGFVDRDGGRNGGSAPAASGKLKQPFGGKLTVGPPMPKVSNQVRRASAKRAASAKAVPSEPERAPSTGKGYQPADTSPSMKQAVTRPKPVDALDDEGTGDGVGVVSESDGEVERGFVQDNLAWIGGGLVLVVGAVVFLMRRGS